MDVGASDRASVGDGGSDGCGIGGGTVSGRSSSNGGDFECSLSKAEPHRRGGAGVRERVIPAHGDGGVDAAIRIHA